MITPVYKSAQIITCSVNNFSACSFTHIIPWKRAGVYGKR